MRSSRVSRLYLQVPPDERIENWSDEQIWDELATRFALEGWELKRGPLLEKGITPMRSFVAEPLRYGRLFLAGDSAHIVPPTGAKGLNLAMNDVRLLAQAFESWYSSGDDSRLERYSDACLRRVWRAQDFSTYMTTLLHRLSDDPFEAAVQSARLDYVVGSEAASRSLAENYVGMPAEWDAWGEGFGLNRIFPRLLLHRDPPQLGELLARRAAAEATPAACLDPAERDLRLVVDCRVVDVTHAGLEPARDLERGVHVAAEDR
jgi:hypothetical protein